MYFNYELPKPKILFDVPSVISMLLNAQTLEEGYFIDSCSLKSAVIVGRLVEAKEVNGQVQFVVNDNTGCITVIVFPELPLSRFTSLYSSQYSLRLGKYVKVTGVLLYTKHAPQLSLEHIASLADHNERTHHLLKALLCQHIRRNEPLTTSQLEDNPQTPVREPGLSLGGLGEKERVILGAARELQCRGEQISQERLYGEVCEKIVDYTEFMEATEYLSSKGYLNEIQ
eukprot:TRINITY_DN10773_c0_g3_i2.p1 TRINITY_DN10773_c0_g3~~TRINITY_DN10773_c0_g3_i2.p1  ORF type:complete len:228 (-),score=48.85 TRINITY_DN10773_c0_g3_i2:459-1142(-)